MWTDCGKLNLVDSQIALCVIHSRSVLREADHADDDDGRGLGACG